MKEPVYIHFDFDDYQPWLMNFNQRDVTYFLWKMVPPGNSHYFYSFGGVNGEPEVAKDQPHMKTLTVKKIHDVMFKEIDGKTMKKVDFLCGFKLRSVNYVIAT